jgi:hypothetical protein
MIGLELELPDIDTSIPIPSKIGKYDMEDFTIVNNNGLANDPKKKYILIGSEVNMTPTETVDEMIENIQELYSLVETKTNYKSNLHVHISVPGLAQDYKKLKKLISYTFEFGGYIMSQIDPLPTPTSEEMKKRIQHLKKSHQYEYPKSYQERILNGTTWEEIRDAHQPIKNGRRLTHLVKRCGINIRSLWDNGTVEFRHFFGTDNIEQYRDAIEWCKLYIDNAIGDQKHPDWLLSQKDWNFPKMSPFDINLQKGWEYTNLEKNKRVEVQERLTKLLHEGKIRKEHIGSMFW